VPQKEFYMEKYIHEPAKQIQVIDSCDVLVAGGGIAGIAAALAAARNGAKVILLEREFALGGMATLGLVTIYLPLCDGEGHQLCFGICEELLKLSFAHGAEAMYPKAWLENGTFEERVKNRYITQFNPHLFALRAEALLKELGVTILYGTLAANVSMDGDRITSVIVENKSGRTAIDVKSVVDCTGDADICHLAGAKTALHEGGNGLASWYYYLTGGEVRLKMFGLADIAPGRGPGDAGGDAQTVPDGTAMSQSIGADRFSGVDGPELSRCLITAHQTMFNDIMSVRETKPDYVPVTMSTIPLVRMSRRIVGVEDIDITSDHVHNDLSIGMTGDWRKRGPAFEIPYTALYGREVKNLIAAGRIISATDPMWDITRVIPPCAVTGEAAGTAAAMTDDFAALSVTALQAQLEKQGVKLHF
jgi:hypothetical protein